MSRSWNWLVFGVIVGIGCSSAPSRVTAPPVNANAGADAIAALDKNSDGGIDQEEAKGAPAFLEKGTKARFDADGDGKITAKEIDARVKKWEDSKVGLTQYSLTLNLDGRPLEGATVTLVPEPWLGDQLKNGTGTTDATGRVNLSIAAGDLKPDEAGLQGMRLGVYKIQVTHPSITIPPKYNSETTLGVEVAYDDIEAGRLVLNLTSR